MRGALFWMMVPLALLTGCGEISGAKHKTKPVDREAILSQIQEVENIQMDAVARRDLQSAVSVYTPAAQFYAPGAGPAFGREDILTSFKAMTDDDGYAALVDANSRKSWIAASGDLVATGFTGRIARTIGGKVVTSPFINRTIWVRQPDGGWQIDSDVNALLPMAPK